MITLVAGAGGFIGGHLTARLLAGGHDVRAVDVKPMPQWYQAHAGAQNVVADLREWAACCEATTGVERVYNLAADMGGMGFIEQNKAACMLSVLITTHLLMAARDNGCALLFFASSACVYPASKQSATIVAPLKESDVYPAEPEDGYGWEKLFGERMLRHFHEDFGIETRCARYHNVYGPHGTWQGGREKAPAAICRKVIQAKQSGNHQIEVWGDGNQTRSFLYVDDCIEGTERLVASDVRDPINIGSEETVSINQLIDVVADIAGIQVRRQHDLAAPQGVRGRSSDNTLVRSALQWEPTVSLRTGLEATYAWIEASLASVASDTLNA